jgi:electron transfer flavoprotein alpha subunit
MLAVVVVREGVLPSGADETIAECSGRGLLIGTRCHEAVHALKGIATELIIVEAESFRPTAFAAALAVVLEDEPIIVLPGSPDGRDLAPRLAAQMRRPALLHASSATPHRVALVRRSGLDIHDVTPPPRYVATLIPGLRGVEIIADADPIVTPVDVALPVTDDAEVVAVLPPDATTADLAEAPRIVGGGAGLDSAVRFDQLATIGAAVGASVGATRVITDRGWVEHVRQIGTTGVVVNPRLYVAFGVSGAVQHTSGLGDPDHVISVNTDPYCPMMQMADLAIVADANAVLDELEKWAAR